VGRTVLSSEALTAHLTAHAWISILGLLGSTECISCLEPLMSEQQDWVDDLIPTVAAAIEKIRARDVTNPIFENDQDGAASIAHQQADMSKDDSTHQTDDVDALFTAMRLSKTDIPSTGIPLNSDGVVVLRLTRMARSPQLREHLRTTKTLAPARQRVEEAGCALEPEFGDGAQFFVPLTHEQIAEAELELSFDYVLLLNADVELFKAALHEFNCKGKRRPVLAPVDLGTISKDRSQHLSSTGPPASGSSTVDTTVADEDEGPVEVEPVGFFNIRTDSSLGYPEAAYP
jgi:hypothetical protein